MRPLDRQVRRELAGARGICEGAGGGVSMADVATAWVCGHAAVTSVIVGISKLEQLKENLRPGRRGR